MTESERVEIIPWEGGLGVVYHRGSRHTAHALGPEDWPVVETLANAGDLGFRSEALRVLFEAELLLRRNR